MVRPGPVARDRFSGSRRHNLGRQVTNTTGEMTAYLTRDCRERDIDRPGRSRPRRRLGRIASGLVSWNVGYYSFGRNGSYARKLPRHLTSIFRYSKRHVLLCSPFPLPVAFDALFYRITSEKYPDVFDSAKGEQPRIEITDHRGAGMPKGVVRQWAGETGLKNVV